MADQQESGSDDGGVVDPRQEQQASAQSNDERPSVDVNGIAAKLLDNPEFVKLLDKRVQSTKDRRFSEQEKQIGEFQTQLERLDNLMKDQGLSRSQAINQMELEDRLVTLERKLGSDRSDQSPSPNGADPKVDVDAVFSAVGIDPNSPQVTEFYKSGEVTPKNILEFVVKAKGHEQQPPSPAQAMPTPTGQSPAQKDLIAQYTEEISNERLTRSQRLEIRQKYRKKGLAI